MRQESVHSQSSSALVSAVTRLRKSNTFARRIDLYEAFLDSELLIPVIDARSLIAAKFQCIEQFLIGKNKWGQDAVLAFTDATALQEFCGMNSTWQSVRAQSLCLSTLRLQLESICINSSGPKAICLQKWEMEMFVQSKCPIDRRSFLTEIVLHDQTNLRLRRLEVKSDPKFISKLKEIFSVFPKVQSAFISEAVFEPVVDPPTAVIILTLVKELDGAEASNLCSEIKAELEQRMNKNIPVVIRSLSSPLSTLISASYCFYQTQRK